MVKFSADCDYTFCKIRLFYTRKTEFVSNNQNKMTIFVKTALYALKIRVNCEQNRQ